MKHDEKSDTHEATNPQKKPYAAPSLVKYGSVEKLTSTGGSVNMADANLPSRMPCL